MSDPRAVLDAHKMHRAPGCVETSKGPDTDQEHCEPYQLANRLASVAKLAEEPCENYTEGSCADDEPWKPGDYYGRAPEAPNGANQYCWPCRLRHYLGITL